MLITSIPTHLRCIHIVKLPIFWFIQQQCDITTGICLDGCVVGYTGQFCNVSCISTFYGENCLKRCSHFCTDTNDDRLCDVVDGNCTTGCKPGYIPPKCVDPCRFGSYGQDCLLRCSCVRDSPCDHVEGCTVACADLLKPPTCRCLINYWGDNCDEECGVCADKLDCFLNGSCPHGCAPGFQLPYCRKQCEFGYYGANCQHKCGNCRFLDWCRKTDGICRGGCKPHWFGMQCQNSCVAIDHQHTECQSQTILSYGASFTDVVIATAVAMVVFAFILGITMLIENLYP